MHKAAALVTSILALVLVLAVFAGSAGVYLTFADAAPTATPGDPDATDPPTGTDGQPATVPTPVPTERLLAPVDGTILLVRDGDILAAAGDELVPVASKGSLSDPAWSADGTTIYAMSTTHPKVQTSYSGLGFHRYTFDLANVVSMHADGSGLRVIRDNTIGSGRSRWFTTMLQPAISPDGRTIAVASDGPAGTGDVVLSTIGASGSRLRKLGIASTFGHNDPAWSHDGKRIAFTQSLASGPRIGIYTVARNRLQSLPGACAAPAWSPDDTHIVCERPSAKGRDLVLIDAMTGAMVTKLTRGGDSFAPTWSPAGDQVAYLRRDGLDTDLWVMTLSADGQWSVAADTAITHGQRLDPRSSPAWWMPTDRS